MKMVTVECNVYFDPTSASVDHIEGEDWEFVETTTDRLTHAPSSSSPAIMTPPSQSESSSTPPITESELEDEESRLKHTCKPSQRVLDILTGRTVNSFRPSDPLVAPGVQVPTAVVEKPEGDETLDMLMAVDLVEYALVAEMSEVEGLEPQSLAEVK